MSSLPDQTSHAQALRAKESSEPRLSRQLEGEVRGVAAVNTTAARKELTLKADLPERGVRETTIALDSGTVTAVPYEDPPTTEGEWLRIRRSGSRGAALTSRSAPPRESMSECSITAVLGTLVLAAAPLRKRSVIVPPVYCDGLSETDGSSHPSDTKNSSMRRTVSV